MRSLNWVNRFCENKERVNGTLISGFDANYDKNSDYDRNPRFRVGGFHTDPLNDGVDTVWSEGTLGAVLAFFQAGRKSEAMFYLREMDKMVAANGGIKYSTSRGSVGKHVGKRNSKGELENATHHTITGTSAASTAWYLLAKKRINPFNTFPVVLRDGIFKLLE